MQWMCVLTQPLVDEYAYGGGGGPLYSALLGPYLLVAIISKLSLFYHVRN